MLFSTYQFWSHYVAYIAGSVDEVDSDFDIDETEPDNNYSSPMKAKRRVRHRFFFGILILLLYVCSFIVLI